MSKHTPGNARELLKQFNMISDAELSLADIQWLYKNIEQLVKSINAELLEACKAVLPLMRSFPSSCKKTIESLEQAISKAEGGK